MSQSSLGLKRKLEYCSVFQKSAFFLWYANKNSMVFRSPEDRPGNCHGNAVESHVNSVE